MIIRQYPSQEYLRAAFDYDTVSGHLIWKRRSPADFKSQHACNVWNAKHPGTVAGCRSAVQGYTVVRLFNRLFAGHRLIWIWNFGEIPAGLEVDHIFGVKSDNRIQNLRLATHAQNNKNVLLQKNNTSGYCGVTWHSGTKKWRAEVFLDGKRHHLGLFKNAKDADSASTTFRLNNDFTVNHGKRA